LPEEGENRVSDGEAAHAATAEDQAMSEVARKLTYDWDDYRSWNDDQRWEVIGGEAYTMTPAPTSRHQQIVTELSRQIGNVLDGKPCRAFVSPIDVKLSRDDLLQPDIIVVCDDQKIRRTHIEGAPDMVVEVLSPSTALHDRVHKMGVFARYGVKEVWLVTPYPWLVEVFVLEGESYRLGGYYSKDDTVTSRALPSVTINLSPVFDFPLDPGEEIEMVKEGRPPYGTRE